MKRKRYSDDQIAFALWQAEGSVVVEKICSKLGVAEVNLLPVEFGRTVTEGRDSLPDQFAGTGTVEIRRLEQL